MDIKKKQEDSSKSVQEEEISEKKTSVLGYVLLSLMIIFIITTGNTVFYDLSKIPDEPVSVSSCVSRLSYIYEIHIIESCELDPDFTTTDVSFGLDTLYRAMYPLIVLTAESLKELEETNEKIDRLEKSRTFLYQKYGIQLQEVFLEQSSIS